MIGRPLAPGVLGVLGVLVFSSVLGAVGVYHIMYGKEGAWRPNPRWPFAQPWAMARPANSHRPGPYARPTGPTMQLGPWRAQPSQVGQPRPRPSQASQAGAMGYPPRPTTASSTLMNTVLAISHWDPNWTILKCRGCGRPFIGPGSVFNSDVERVRRNPLPLPPCQLCKKTLSANGAERHRSMFGYPGPESSREPAAQAE